MNSFKLQTRYAQSLFILAKENELVDRVYEDMLLIKKVCEETPQLKAILKNPVIKPSKKKNIIRGVCDFYMGRGCICSYKLRIKQEKHLQ